MATVGAGKPAHHVERTLGKVAGDAVAHGLEALAGDGHVHAAPGDRVVHVGGVHDEAVLGRAAGALAGLHGKGAVVKQLALPRRERVLHELGNGEVNVDGSGVGTGSADAQGFKHLHNRFVCHDLVLSAVRKNHCIPSYRNCALAERGIRRVVKTRWTDAYRW